MDRDAANILSRGMSEHKLSYIVEIIAGGIAEETFSRNQVPPAILSYPWTGKTTCTRKTAEK